MTNYFRKKISRQKIYPTSFIPSIFFSLFSHSVRDSVAHLSNWFNKNINRSPIYLGRARVGLYLAAKIAFEEKRGVCLISPLTILDVANMVTASGAEIEYYDLKPKRFEVNTLELENRLAKGGVSSVIITHYFYVQDDIESIIQLCKKYDVCLIEDCAISLGAKFSGQPAGAFGRFSVFSFSLFKFLNNFWGGAIFCQNPEDHNKVEAIVSKWRKLSLFDYLPQLGKFIKFGLVTITPIFQFVFILFKFGIKNNIKLITNNIQNDPYVPFSRVIPKNCFSVPANFFYLELASKIDSFCSLSDKRQSFAFYIFNGVRNKNIFAIPENIKFHEASFISLPLIFSNESDRDSFSLRLLEAGIDSSKQLYRNIANIPGYNSVIGDVPEIQRLSKSCLFVPIHRGLSFKNLDVIINLLNSLD